MGKCRRIQIYGFFIFISLLTVFYLGCHKETVNLRELTPEEQFEYAKQIFDKKDYYKAKLQFTIIVLNNPGHQIIEKAQFYLSESHYFQKEYLLAVEEYEKLIRSLPRSPYVDDARFKVAMCYFNLAPKYSLDQEYTYKAISQFQQFLEEYPNSELRPETEKMLKTCVHKLAKKEYKSGELYRKMSYFQAALISFDSVLERYHDSEFADDALYWKGECHRKLREWEEAEKAFTDLISKHAQSDWASRAESKIKEIQREKEKQSQLETGRVEQ